MKQISIIIATFNAAKTLERCLQSIISQKQQEVELLVIDGQSNDETLTILEQYREHIDVIISEPDRGLYDAWNKGIRKSQGAWMWFIGADDYILPQAVSTYLNFIHEHSEELSGLDLITAEEELVDLTGRKIKTIGRPFRWEEYRKLMLIAHGATLHHRSLYTEFGDYDLNFPICADYEFLFRKGASIRSLHIPQTMLSFAIGGASYSWNSYIESFRIKQKYQAVSWLTNVYLFTRQVLAKILKDLRYTTH